MSTAMINIEIDIFAALILLVIFDRTKWRYMAEPQKIYKTLYIVLLGVLFADAGSWLTNRPGFPLIEILNPLTNYLYWFLTMFPCYLGMLYCVINISETWYKRLRIIGLIPLAIGLILLLIDPVTGWTVTFTEDYIYHRGSHFMIVGSMPFIHNIMALIIIAHKVIKTKSYKRMTYIKYGIYIGIPFVGALLQILFYGTNLIWAAMTISMLICYVYILHGNVDTDPLTGLGSRKRYEMYARYQWDSLLKDKESMYIIVLDLNRFKKINDLYGHAEGDRALLLATDVVKSSAALHSGFCARIGGDEFAIVLSDVDAVAVDETVRCLRASIIDTCKDYELPYQLTFAIGYAGTDSKTHTELSKLFAMADNQMYFDKEKFRENEKLSKNTAI